MAGGCVLFTFVAGSSSASSIDCTAAAYSSVLLAASTFGTAFMNAASQSMRRESIHGWR